MARRDRRLRGDPCRTQAQRGARRKRRGQHRGQRRLRAAEQAVQYGFAEAVGTVSAGVEIRKLQASGQSAPQARASRAPVQLQMVALFNPTEGYGSFVVPAVALLILQQTLLMGAAMLLSLIHI